MAKTIREAVKANQIRRRKEARKEAQGDPVTPPADHAGAGDARPAAPASTGAAGATPLESFIAIHEKHLAWIKAQRDAAIAARKAAEDRGDKLDAYYESARALAFSEAYCGPDGLYGGTV